MATFPMSVPVEQPIKKVQKKLAEEISSGKYKVGVLIAPQEFKTIRLQDGEITEEMFSVFGRKNPLLDIRNEMFEKHRDYMRTRTDDQYTQMTKDSIISDLIRINEYLQNDDREVLFERLISFERTRHLMFLA